MVPMPQNFTTDAWCLSLSNNIHNGQQVNKTWRVYLLLANKELRRASAPHLTCLMYATHRLWGFPQLVSRTKGIDKVQSQDTTYIWCPHMLGHATQCHHLVPNCLGTEGRDKPKSSCALDTIQGVDI